MCAITGCVVKKGESLSLEKLKIVFNRAVDRGRDSFGLGYIKDNTVTATKRIGCYSSDMNFNQDTNTSKIIIANHRAEPTTEYIREKKEKDVHPFIAGNLMLVHNGIIANDKDLAKKYGMDQLIGEIDTRVLTEVIASKCTNEQEAAEFIVRNVQGSYAIALSYGNCVALITNYKPLYLNFQKEGIYFASLPDYITFGTDILTDTDNIQKVPAYSYVLIGTDGIQERHSFKKDPNEKALVVCSGGLDSTVALKEAVNTFGKENVTLLHFKYHCNAEQKEVESVRSIAEVLGIELVFMPLDIFGGMITESPILRKEGAIQEYDKGVEFAYEWVPARNLVMMALATAYAEAKGFGYIYLGNNLEESGAYPDNEMEFIRKLQDLMPNAVKDGYSLELVQPVGNLMKHEIVAKGLKIQAPLHLTWSCYKTGAKHCGVCGPCRMRRVGFEMAGLKDVIEYEK